MAPTIVMTQRGARAAFQAQLRDHGVEVVEFDFLTPEAVAAYCFERGFLQVRRDTFAKPSQAAYRAVSRDSHSLASKQGTRHARPRCQSDSMILAS